MFDNVVVIDCKGHLLGRLASVLVKELMAGQRVVCVRTEELNISGSLFRNKLKFAYFLKKRTNTNPKKGPIHFRAPGRILWRVIRGMMPHKTARAKAALDRLKVFEGLPHPYDKQKRQVVPQALRHLRLRPNRKYCRLGDLAGSMGWRHNDLIARLEEKRQVKATAYHKTKQEKAKLVVQAKAAAGKELEAVNAQLAVYGY
mmetsp:Transcript_7240/g.8195  ORF Transcript_7240/g.8195 Transcript_7240/m.8195 type:complete len:201 (+) Transcript_7240:37-639(+)